MPIVRDCWQVAKGAGRGGQVETVDKVAMQTALLDWYDRHARSMPWRMPPGSGQRPDPYRVWLSEVMLQQTTVAAVRAYFLRFVARWPDVGALAAAADADVLGAWAGLGYYSRARNLLACARAVVALHGGTFPADRAALLALPGIGPYTASAIAAIAFDQPETVLDGNVERVMARAFAVREPLPGAKPQLLALATALTPAARPGDHAQAVMDLGATVCTPRNPACGICPWRAPCAGRAAGIAADLPRKAARRMVPVRQGHAFVGRRADGAWLLETRPPRGLLGGMLGWPGSAWGDAPVPAPPLAAAWARLGEVRHTFTHFHLRLTVWTALLPADAVPERGQFHTNAAFDPQTLPTLMRKVFHLASTGRRPD